MPLLLNVLLRLAACGAVTWLAYRHLELVGAVVTIPLYGVALANPIMEAVAAAHHGTKAMVLADVQGRYFQHRGQAIDIVEDDEDRRWLLVRDARKVLPSLPRDEVLLRLFPDRAMAVPPSRDLRIRADALVDHLRNAHEPAGVKFKVWLEKEVLLVHKRAGSA